MAERGVDPQQAIRQTGAWLEYVWLVNRDVLNAPLPYAASRDRKRLDVNLCGSGRKTATGTILRIAGHGFGGHVPLGWTLLSAANTIVHEFGHMIQFYSGGLNAGRILARYGKRGRMELARSQSVLLCANRLVFRLPGIRPLYSPARYGANPILAYLFEKDDTRALVFGAWQRDRRDAAGMGLEDYVPAFVRSGRKTGSIPRAMHPLRTIWAGTARASSRWIS